MFFGHLLGTHHFSSFFSFLSRIIVFKLLIINFEIIILIWSIIEVSANNWQKHGRLRLFQPAQGKGARVEKQKRRHQLRDNELAHANQLTWWINHVAPAWEAAPPARRRRQRPTNQEVQYSYWPKWWSSKQDDLEHAKARKHSHSCPRWSDS